MKFIMQLKLLLALMTLTTLSMAETNVPTERTIPRGTNLDKVDETGTNTVFFPDQEYKCFTVAEWKEVAHVINDYRWLRSYALNLELSIDKYKMQITLYQEQVDIWKDTVDRIEKNRTLAFDLVKQEQKNRLKLEFKNNLTMWLAIGVAAVEAGVIGALAATRK